MKMMKYKRRAGINQDVPSSTTETTMQRNMHNPERGHLTSRVVRLNNNSPPIERIQPETGNS